MSNDVTLDYTNMLEESVGPADGVTTLELDDLAEQSYHYHEELQNERREGKLSFLELPYDTAQVHAVMSTAEQLRDQCENFVVLGIGGSALGNIMLQGALRHPYFNLLPREKRTGPRLFVMDNVDPNRLSALMDVVDLEETVFNVITKSGTTSETMAQFLVVACELHKRLGDSWEDHVVVTTDPARGPLRDFAQQEHFRSFPIPPGVGGRYSVLSAVGLLSAAMTGIDIESLLEGARHMDQRCTEPSLTKNPAYLHAALHYLLYRKGKRLHVMMPYCDALASFADWFRQLWAESLGKRLSTEGSVVMVGPTPIKALGTTDQHSQLQLYVEGPADKAFTFMAADKLEHDLHIPERFPEAVPLDYLTGHSLGELLDSERVATALVLTENNRPNCTVNLPEVNPHAVGQLIILFELSAVFSGKLYHINPFDQPGVEASKEATYALMGREGFEDLREHIRKKLDSGTSHVL